MFGKTILSKAVLVSVLVVAALFVFQPAAQAKTLKLLSSWPVNMIFVQGALQPFEANLKEASGGGLSYEFFGPDVIPTMEQFQPLQSGVFDLLYTIPAYHLGATAIGAAVDAIEPDPAKRRESGVFDFIDQQYQKLGLKLIALVPITDVHILTNEPLEGRDPSFKGLKIRTTPTVAPMIQTMGGASVNLPSGEVYTALQKGVIDGATIITFGAIDYKWYEVTKYMTRPTFGYISTIMLMNLDKYNALTAEEKAALEAAGRKTETDAMAFFSDKKAAEDKQLKELGMKETQMTPADAERADRLYREAIWEIAKKKSKGEVEKLHELAKSKGMAE